MASTMILPSHPRQDEQHQPATSRLATPPTIWQNHAFCRLWAGETVSLFGTEITVLALPLTAIIALKASAFEVGILDALAWLPYLVFALALGVWVDQRRRRPLIILANVTRAGLLVLIPLAWIGHFLTFPLLASVAFGAGALSVIFNLTYQAYVPTILPQHQILSGNSKLQVSASAAKIGGPGLAGILVQTLSAPLAIVVDALSFLIAGCSVIAIRTPEPMPVVVKQPRSLRADIHDGLRYTFSHPHLRAMTGMASTYNFAEQILLTLWIVYALKHGITPAWLGGILAVGSGGALAGSLLAGSLLRWLGIRTALRWAITTSAVGLLLIPLANGAPTSMSLLLALAFGINGAGLAALNIYLRSIRQQTVPAAMMGRVVASYTFFSMGTVPIGAFLAGTLSLVIGIQGTLIAGAIIACFAILWVWNITVPITTQAILPTIRPLKGNMTVKVRHAPRVVRAVPYVHSQRLRRTLNQRCG